MTAPSTSPQQSAVILRVVWTAFFAAVIFYAVTLAVLTRLTEVTSPSVGETMRAPFWLAAVAIGAGSIWWRRSFSRKASADEAEDLASGREPRDAFERLRVPCLVTWAMSEAVAVLGFCLGILTSAMAEFVPFGLAAIILLYLHRPNTWPGWPR